MEHERHQIAPEHDLIITVKELNPRTATGGKRSTLIYV